VHNKTPIAVIGEASNLNYPYELLGDNPKDIENFLKSKEGFAKKFLKAEKPMLIVGMGAFQREDGFAVHHTLYNFAQKAKLIKKDWNGFNVLHQAAGRVGGLELGFVPQRKTDADFSGMITAANKGKLKLLYLNGVDSFVIRSVFGDDVFIIYQGHHGDVGARAADIVLPGAAYTEKDAIYINTEGRPQQAYKSISPLGDAKEDWKIIRAIAEKCDVDLGYNTLSELRAQMEKSYKGFKNIGLRQDIEWKEFANDGKNVNIGDAPFINIITDYYLTDPIARASETMNKCSNVYAEHNEMEIDETDAVAAE
jgi:NADH-quinone oxidoreductase subunit G